jgi:hypothetical protein
MDLDELIEQIGVEEGFGNFAGIFPDAAEFGYLTQPEKPMKSILLKLLRDPEAARTKLAELKEGIIALHQLAPGLRTIIENNYLPFTTLNLLTKFSDKLLCGAVIVKEAVEKLAELTDSNRSADPQHPPPDQRSV